MCGRFAQAHTREEYLAYQADEANRDITYDPEPIGRYNVTPGTKVLLLSERDEQLHLDPVLWGYEPGWWDKPPLMYARLETVATSRMFKPLWQHGRAIVTLQIDNHMCDHSDHLYFIKSLTCQRLTIISISNRPRHGAKCLPRL